MRVLLLFVDGVGVGRRDPSVNPFASVGSTILGRFEDELADNGNAKVGAAPVVPLPPDAGAAAGYFRAVDATLGVAGLPQSATGQATILTGANVPAAVGEHRSGVPGPQVRAIIEERSLFRSLAAAGRRATFANAYTPRFFKTPRPRLSATTLSVQAAGLPLRTLDDLAAGRAVYHDYTLRSLEQRTGVGMPERSADQAARTLADLSGEHDFVLHEHFLTDLAGHRGSAEERLTAADRIEDLIAETTIALRGTDTLLLAISDHGNLEDGTTRHHTLAKVPLVAIGPGAEDLAREVGRLDELAPAILRRLV